MSNVRLLILEPDPARSELLARSFEELRTPVTVAASVEEVALAAASGPVVVAASGLGGRGAARLRALREDPRTAALAVLAIAPRGAGSVAALKAGADDVVPWPSPAPVVRARLRGLFADARARAESHRTVAAFAGLLEAFEAREPHRIEHSARVGRLAAGMGRRAGLSDAEVERVRIGGVLHDIGTVAIPDGILYKREPLTDGELAVVKSHPVIGFSLIRDVPAMEPYGPFVLRHHERIDGSGYPDGLRGAEIPLPVQLVALADAFDAMTSSRPYRAVRNDGQTLSVLEEEARRGQWDRALFPLLVAEAGTAGG